VFQLVIRQNRSQFSGTRGDDDSMYGDREINLVLVDVPSTETYTMGESPWYEVFSL